MAGAATDEPVRQAAPPVAPGRQSLRDGAAPGVRFRAPRGTEQCRLSHSRLTRVRHGVRRLPRRGGLQQPVHPGALQPSDQFRDLRSAIGQVSDEALDVLDEPVLVRDEGFLVAVLEVDRAPQRSHERLRIVGQAAEALGEREQQQVRLRRVQVRVRQLDQREQRTELLGDVRQRHRLKLAAPPKRVLVHGDRLERRLPVTGQLIEIASAVEVLDGGHASGIGVSTQIAPLDQLLQRSGDCVDGHRLPVRHRLQDAVRGHRSGFAQLRRHVLRSQMHGEPFASLPEHSEHHRIQRGVRCTQIGERLRLRHACHIPHSAGTAQIRGPIHRQKPDGSR